MPRQERTQLVNVYGVWMHETEGGVRAHPLRQWAMARTQSLV